jgi:hypothetical protein
MLVALTVLIICASMMCIYLISRAEERRFLTQRKTRTVVLSSSNNE